MLVQHWQQPACACVCILACTSTPLCPKALLALAQGSWEQGKSAGEPAGRGTPPGKDGSRVFCRLFSTRWLAVSADSEFGRVFGELAGWPSAQCFVTAAQCAPFVCGSPNRIHPCSFSSPFYLSSLRRAAEETVVSAFLFFVSRRK